MVSKQTRRSVSISGATYAKLKAYCQQHKRSMSGAVEEALKIAFPATLGLASKTVSPPTRPGAAPSPGGTRPH